MHELDDELLELTHELSALGGSTAKYVASLGALWPDVLTFYHATSVMPTFVSSFLATTFGCVARFLLLHTHHTFSRGRWLLEGGSRAW